MQKGGRGVASGRFQTFSSPYTLGLTECLPAMTRFTQTLQVLGIIPPEGLRLDVVHLGCRRHRANNTEGIPLEDQETQTLPGSAVATLGGVAAPAVIVSEPLAPMALAVQLLASGVTACSLRLLRHRSSKKKTPPSPQALARERAAFGSSPFLAS